MKEQRLFYCFFCQNKIYLKIPFKFSYNQIKVNQMQQLNLTIKNIYQKTERELSQIFEHAFNDKITKLDLSGNNLSELNQNLITNICVLETICELDLSNNQLTSLPGYLTELANLEKLELEGNPIISPSPETVSIGTEAILKYLKKPICQQELRRIITQAIENNVKILDLRNRGLSELPKEIGLLTGLEALLLDNNKLRSLPAEITKLVNLKRLELVGNEFTSFPLETIHLPGLETLYLESNSLQIVPPEIKYLTNLKHLTLTANDLTSLPPEIGQLQNLVQLEVLFNNLTSLPKEIGMLKNLTELDLSGNNINTNPDDFAGFKNIKILNFEGL